MRLKPTCWNLPLCCGLILHLLHLPPPCALTSISYNMSPPNRSFGGIRFLSFPFPLLVFFILLKTGLSLDCSLENKCLANTSEKVVRCV